PPEDLRAYIAAKYTPDVQRQEIADSAFHYRLALEGSVLVGYCMSGPVSLEIEPRAETALELRRLYVAPGMKGAGVAQALMDEALDWMRRRGANAAYLSVWEDNHRAQAFYRRYGFEQVGEHKFMVGASADRDQIWRAAL